MKPVPPPEGRSTTPTKLEPNRDQLVALADRGQLWCTVEEEAFVSIRVEQPAPHTKHWPVRSEAVRGWLIGLCHSATKKFPSSNTLNEAVAALEAKAHVSGEVHPVHLRVAEKAGDIYIDLADDLWRAIKITPQGWEVITEPPVKFRRTKAMQTLPISERGGTIEELRPFLNVDCDDDFRLAVAWALGALRPSGPYPILILTGEQGSSKTTFARVLRSLVDPSRPLTRGLPRSERDLMVAAENNWVLCFDNLSGMGGWLPDAFCRLATGAGFGVRKLYTDKEETLFDASRPIVLNSIGDLVPQLDFVDRVILLRLTQIPEEARRLEADIWADFEKVLPRILGVLFDIMATALARLPTIKPTRLPRMADFALWGMATAEGLGWHAGTFLKVYEQNRAAAVADAVEGNVLAHAVTALARDQGKWVGTATELQAVLIQYVPLAGRDGAGLPRAANSLSSHLKRLKPALLNQGVNISVGDRRGHGGTRVIEIRARGDDGDEG